MMGTPGDYHLRAAEHAAAAVEVLSDAAARLDRSGSAAAAARAWQRAAESNAAVRRHRELAQPWTSAPRAMPVTSADVKVRLVRIRRRLAALADPPAEASGRPDSLTAQDEPQELQSPSSARLLPATADSIPGLVGSSVAVVARRGKVVRGVCLRAWPLQSGGLAATVRAADGSGVRHVSTVEPIVVGDPDAEDDTRVAG